MISNERPSPYGNRSYRDYRSNTHTHSHPHPQTPKPHVAEDTLRSDKVQIERKTFLFSLKENPRGRFLRITEDVAGRRDTIIIPAPGLEDFKRVIDEMARASAETPTKE